MLFRTEEVVDASATTVERVDGRWFRFGQLRVLDGEREAIEAVRTGVFDVEPVVLMDAADQQHEVNRSGDVEDVTAGPNGVEE